MSAKLAPSAKPSHAVVIWTDDRSIYIEVPTIAALGVPYVTTFPLHEGGLSKALNFLRTRYEELPRHQKNYTAPAAPVTLRNGKPPIQTEAQRDQALVVLRKLGLV